MKRLIDIAVAGLGLIIVSPLLLLVAVAIAINMGTPVLFRQQRPGLYGRPFTILKFRTMTSPDGSKDDAARLTRLGRFLRSTSLDELPELVNVLKGEMSLVGPRPLLVEYLPLYSATEARRHDVRPGLTGWAQVNGRNAVTWEERFRLDVWYVENQSLALDCRILLMTLGKVLKREGISAAGEATMPKFRGSGKP